MRFAFLIALAACGGPIRAPYATPSSAPSEPEARVMRPPTNAPPDPIGTSRPGTRSCTENRDCKTGETCFAPDYVPPGAAASPFGAPASPFGASAAPGAASSPGVAPAGAPAAQPATPAGQPAAGPSGQPGAAPAGAVPSGQPAAPGASPGGQPGAPAARPAQPGAPAAPPGAAAQPGTAPLGTPAAPVQCQGDAQCSHGLVCSLGACVAPCAQGSCPMGLECRAGGRCMPIPCTAPQAGMCAQNFRCNSGSGACERTACTSRAQCDSGVCYQGRCFAHDAYCMPRP